MNFSANSSQGARQGSLHQLKILDFTALLPGPFATWHLSDLGAEVLRIVHPKREDLLLEHKPRLFEVFHRGKESLKLDLKQDSSKDKIEKLIQEGFDVILEGFRPSTMDRLGLGFEKLSEKFPQLIYCSLTAYPQNSKFSDYAGHDLNHYSLSGLQDLWRNPDSKPPLPAVPLADSMAGLHCALGIVSAAFERKCSGLGQRVQVNLMESIDSLAQLSLSEASPQIEQKPSQDLLTGLSPYNLYPTKDGRYVAMAALEPHFITQILELLEIPREVLNDMHQMKVAFETQFLQKTWQEWRELFENHDLCVSPVLNSKEAMERIKKQGSLIQVGDSYQIRGPIQMSRTQKIDLG